MKEGVHRILVFILSIAIVVFLVSSTILFVDEFFFSGRAIEEVNIPEHDIDNDRVADDADNCIAIYNHGQGDIDNDGIGDVCDNCIYNANKGQEDTDNNGIGDICQEEKNE
jgi:hypothetical protein